MCKSMGRGKSMGKEEFFFLINDVGTTRHMFGKAILLLPCKNINS